jgi:endonuclease/exonuclease/phosphatase family metal-dependent hydrolase
MVGSLPPPQRLLLQPLKILSLNTYLVSRPFNQNRITYPEQRAVRIRQFLQSPQGGDLCFLQEVWGSGFSQLVTRQPRLSLPQQLKQPPPQQDDFQLPPNRTPFLDKWGGWPMGTFGSELIYTAYLTLWHSTGGLYDMCRRGGGAGSSNTSTTAATCVYRSKHTYTKSRSQSRKGVEVTWWKNIRKWESRYNLLVFHTHLDPWSVENRQFQVQELEQFMTRVTKKLIDVEDCKKTCILVVGDFNVKFHETKEYESLFMSRCWKDLMATTTTTTVPSIKDKKGCAKDDDTDNTHDPYPHQQQHTYAEQNQLACCPEDYGRIDYIFAVDVIDGRTFLPLKCVSSTILVQPPGEELSDHYPLVVEVIPDI